MSEEVTKKQEKAKLSFNMAIDYTEKISIYLDEFERYWCEGKLQVALWHLKKVWHALSPFLDEKENKAIRKEFNGTQRWVVLNYRVAIISLRLENLNLHLRKKLNECGLLIPASSDPRFMFKKK